VFSWFESNRGAVGRLAGEGGWVLAGQLGALVGSLIGIRIITSVVSPEVFGQVALVLGMISLSSDFFCSPILHGVSRFFPNALAADRIGSFRSLTWRLLARRLAFAASLLFAIGVGAEVYWRSQGMLVAFGFAVVLLGLNTLRSFELNLLNASRRQRPFGIWSAVDAWMRPLGVWASVMLLGATAWTVVLGHAVGAAISNLAFRRSVLHGNAEANGRQRWSREFGREVLRFAAPLPPLALLAWMTHLSDRYVLAAASGAEAAGIYAAAYGLASGPFLAYASVVNLTLRPVLFGAVARGDRAQERRALLLWLVAAAGGSWLGVALLTAFREPIVHLVLAERFWGAAAIVPWIGAAYAMQAMSQSFEGLIFADRRTGVFTVLHAIGAVGGLALYLILIPRHGVMGAAVATFCTLTLIFVATAMASRAAGRFFEPRGRKPGAGG
jgi:O-antigen/teichoic acid export membrane protein